MQAKQRFTNVTLVTPFGEKNQDLLVEDDLIVDIVDRDVPLSDEFQIFDGETNFPRIIILKFPTYEKALEWYNSEEYKPIKQIRLDNSEGTNIIIKGI